MNSEVPKKKKGRPRVKIDCDAKDIINKAINPEDIKADMAAKFEDAKADMTPVKETAEIEHRREDLKDAMNCLRKTLEKEIIELEEEKKRIDRGITKTTLIAGVFFIVGFHFLIVYFMSYIIKLIE